MGKLIIEFDKEVTLATLEKILCYIGDAINREVSAGGLPGSKYGGQGYCMWELLEE